MTRRSIEEYAEAVRRRYFRAARRAKTEILNEFVATTEMHRKAVIRSLNRRGRSSGKKKRGRPKLYGHEAVVALKTTWEASDCLCSRRLHPFLPELVSILKRCGELTIAEDTKAQLCQMSASTIGRLLRRWREPVAVWGKGQERVGGAVYHVRRQLPMPMLDLDSDNGSDFSNQSLCNRCRHTGLTFTRSRSYKKNDSCHVEQKNWSVIRRVIGYDRFSSREAFKTLENAYAVLRLYIDFFQPVSKLVRRSRHMAKVYKVYDTAHTPYQCLLRSGVLTEDKERELVDTYDALNPLALSKEIRQSVEHLCTLAEG